MPISRRTVLESLAAFLATGGVVTLVSQAAEVDTSQDVRVEFVADDEANLQLRPAIDHHAINFEQTEMGLSMSIRRINRQATTRFEDLIEYGNEGINDIIDISASVDGVDGPAELDAEGFADTPIGPGESTVGLALIISTTDSEDDSEIEATITISVETDA